METAMRMRHAILFSFQSKTNKKQNKPNRYDYSLEIYPVKLFAVNRSILNKESLWKFSSNHCQSILKPSPRESCFGHWWDHKIWGQLNLILLDYTVFYLGLWDSLCNLLSTTMKSRIIPWYDTVLSFPFAPQMGIMTAVVFFLRFFLVFIILSIGSFLQKIPSFVQMSI